MRNLAMRGLRFMTAPADPAGVIVPDGGAPAEAVTASADEFKSEESKAAVLADLMKERDGKKVLAAELAARDAEKAELQARLDAIDAEKLTDAEKTAKAITDSQAALAAKDADLAARDGRIMRLEFQAANGVPAAWIDRLKGETPDELAADWEALKPTLAPAEAVVTPVAAPASLVTGQGPAPKPKFTSLDELKTLTPQQIIEAEKDGRLDGLLGKS